MKHSNVGLIDTTGERANTSTVIFGPEPAHDWCYYYQKIDLARQKLDWQAAADLADDALSLGLEPADASEWLPLLEAYIHVNDEKRSKRIAVLIRVNRGIHAGLCGQMEDLRDSPAAYDRNLLFETLCGVD